jgi:DNA-binding response OmpR family regulator
VWGLGPRAAETRTVEMHVARLRAKLRDRDTDAAVLVTIRGKGYRLDARSP